MPQSQDILFERCGTLGLITLNRPQALNALDLNMCRALFEQLGIWKDDTRIAAVALRGEGEKIFCAGGDVRQIYASLQAQSGYALDFYRSLYVLVEAIAAYPKPIIALAAHAVIGGGVGLVAASSHRIATETTSFRLPETGLGLFPAAGCSYFLPQCPGRIGLFTGLTGRALKAADSVYAGLANAYVPSAHLPDLVEELSTLDLDKDPRSCVSAAIGRCLTPHDMPPLAAQFQRINRYFSAGSMTAVFKNVREAAPADSFAAQVAEDLAAKSPSSLYLAFELERRGREMSLQQCLAMEFQFSAHIAGTHDYAEGLRCHIEQETAQPKWALQPIDCDTAAEIAEPQTAQFIAQAFAEDRPLFTEKNGKNPIN